MFVISLKWIYWIKRCKKNNKKWKKKKKEEINKKKKQAKRVLKYFFAWYKMSKKTLKFDNVAVMKKEFHASERITLNLVDTDKIVISDKFKHNG